MSRLRERSLTVHEATKHLSRLLGHVEKCEEVLTVRSDEPVARLVPVFRPTGGRRFGSLRGQVKVGPAFFDSLPDDECGLRNRWQSC
jgi:antitoxin (DNA-binding transcriptional repressor) of toxin-antitoxin stability system